MSDIRTDLLARLQDSVEQLHRETLEIEKTLTSVIGSIRTDALPTDDIWDKAGTQLESIKKLRESCEECYAAFGGAPLPRTFTEFNGEIAKLEMLVSKKEYMEAKDFLLRLKIHDEEVARLFESVKEDLLALDIENMSKEDCDRTMGKYVSLKGLFTAPPVEKVGYMQKIGSAFDPRILSLAFSGDYSIEDEYVRGSSERPPAEDVAAEAETDRLVPFDVMPELSEIFGRELTEREHEQLKDLREHHDITDELLIFAAQHSCYMGASDVKSVCRKAAEWAGNGCKTRDDAEAYAAKEIFEKRKQESFEAVYRALGYKRKPSGANKAVITGWLENYGLTAEEIISEYEKACKNGESLSVAQLDSLLKTVSDEKELAIRIASGEAEIPAEAKPEPEEELVQTADAVSDDGDAVIEEMYGKSLEELISDVGMVIDDRSDVDVVVEEARTQANKEFSYKKFREMIRSNPFWKSCLAMFYTMDVSHVLEFSKGDESAEDGRYPHTGVEYEDCIDFLYRKGYLRKVYAEGYPIVYAPTKKGAAVYRNRKACEMIGCDHKDRDIPIVEGNAEQYLNSILFERTSCDATRTGDMQRGLYSNIGHITIAYDRDDDTDVTVYVGCACVSAETLSKVLCMVAGETEGLKIKDLYVGSVSMEQAEALANIIMQLKNGSIDEYEVTVHMTSILDEYDDPEPEPEDDPSSSIKSSGRKNKAASKKMKKNGHSAAASKKNEDKAVADDTSAPAADSSDEASNADTEMPPVPGVKADGSHIAEVNARIEQFINEDKLYCALTYAKAASLKDESLKGSYDRLAYAANDPAEHCVYTSDQLFDIYSSFSSDAEYYYQVSSVLRMFFSGQSRYEYNLQATHDSINGSAAVNGNSALNDLIFRLRVFRQNVGFCADKYADYRSRERVEIEKDLAALRKEAASHYENDVISQRMIRTKVINRRYEETWKSVFSKGGDLATYLKAVADDDTELLELASDFVSEEYIKEGLPVSAENIDLRAIDDTIDREWNNVIDKVRLVMKSTDLMGSLRNNMRQHILKAVSAVCSWVELHEMLGDNKDAGYDAYAAVRSKLLSLADEADSYLEKKIESVDASASAGIKVLSRTIKEIRAKVDGSYNPAEQVFFYKEFLRNNYVLLGEDFMPDHSCTIPFVEKMDMLRLVERHAEEKGGTIAENLESYCCDNFRSARLIGEYKEKTEGNLPEIIGTLAEAEKYAEGQLEFIHRDFISDLELAQSYGQLDADDAENRKDAILRIENEWYGWAQETHNFGFYKSLLEEMRHQIRTDAEGRGETIRKQLASLLESDQSFERDYPDYVKSISKMIEKQNYLVAEDMINHLLEGDIPQDIGLFEEDYLAEFQKGYDYYFKLSGKRGQSIANLVRSNDLRTLSSRDQSGAKALKDNWPAPRRAVTPEALKAILNALGIDAEKVVLAKTTNGDTYTFNASIRTPEYEDENSYGHPIYGFGSLAARNGFRVLWITEPCTADELISKYRESAKGKHTIAFLDSALPETERRRLARKIKEEGSSTIFAVIDRVVYMYLIHNYSGAHIGRMLMETVMPFAYFQPYIYDSAKVMPPEMFIGRKEELEKIKDPSGVNIVYGGRQLGKSALLRKAKSDLDGDAEGDRALLIDIKDLDYNDAAKKISQALYDEHIIAKPLKDETDWDEIARALKQALNASRMINYLLLMLDEADKFLESCESVGYSPFNALKDIQQSVGAGRFKFVVAGLRNVVRFTKAATSGNSVLPHLESLTVKPFTTQEARMLLEQPLYYLGFRFPDKNSDLVPMILATANYFPGLIQLYCARLIEALKKNYGDYDESSAPPYIVEEGLIKKVLAESEFRRQIREKFMITLTVGDDDYYYILALILAYLYKSYDREDGYTASEILHIAQELGTKRISEMDVDQVNALMLELCELNVMKVTSAGRYLFSRYNFFSMMGTAEEVDDRLLAYSE